MQTNINLYHSALFKIVQIFSDYIQYFYEEDDDTSRCIQNQLLLIKQQWLQEFEFILANMEVEEMTALTIFCNDYTTE